MLIVKKFSMNFCLLQRIKVTSIAAAWYSRSITPGSLIGGVVGSLIGLPVGQVVFLDGHVSEIPVGVALLFVGFSMCGSAVFAAVVGIVQGGITVTKESGGPHQPS